MVFTKLIRMIRVVINPYKIYCDMTHEGGGWTLYAHHADNIAIIQTQELVKPSDYSVMTSLHWLAVRDNMTIRYDVY
jgi:hypothetical protein